jgi:predicted nucleotide-binding protein (sugar kinase/HSP70/actin superfamily)
MDFSSWTKESVDHLIQDSNTSNADKIKKMEDYIKWITSNLNLTTNQSLYPPINLLVGYYGLMECKPHDQIKEMMAKSYSNEIAERVLKMSNYDILSTLTLFAFVYNLTKSLPSF